MLSSMSYSFLRGPGLRFQGAIRNLSGIVAYYPLNETSGTTATDVIAGANGTINGSPVMGVAGQRGNAITFDGIDDYITLPVAVPTTNLSVGFLLNRTVTEDANDRILDWCAGGPSGGFEVLFPNDSLRLDIYNVGTLQASITSDASTDLNRWYFVAFTYTSNSAKLFLNGVQNGATDTSVTMTDPTQTLTLMRRSSGSSSFTKGNCQHLFVVNGVLTQAQLTSLAQAAGVA